MNLSLLKLESQQYNSAGVVMSQGVTTLSMKFRALTGTTLAQAAANGVLRLASIALNAVIGIGIGFAISKVIEWITSWGNATEEMNKKLQESQERLKDLQGEIRDGQRYLNVLNSQTASTEELTQAREELARLFPAIVMGYDKEGKAILANNEAIEKEIELKKKQAEIEKQAIKDSAENSINEAVKARNKAKTDEENARSMKETYKMRRDDPSQRTSEWTEAEWVAEQNRLISKVAEDEKNAALEAITQEQNLRKVYNAFLPDLSSFSEVQKKVVDNYIQIHLFLLLYFLSV
jgi:5'-3' exonuclease